MKASASGGVDAGLLRLLAGVDLDVEARRAARPLDLVGQRPGQLRPVQRLDDVEEGRPPRAPCWSAAGRSGAAPARRGGSAQRACASCTRFSPNTRLAGGQHRRDALPRAAAWRPRPARRRPGRGRRRARRRRCGPGSPARAASGVEGRSFGGASDLGERSGERPRKLRPRARPRGRPCRALLFFTDPGAHARSRGRRRGACRAARRSSTAPSARRDAGASGRGGCARVARARRLMLLVGADAGLARAARRRRRAPARAAGALARRRLTRARTRLARHRRRPSARGDRARAARPARRGGRLAGVRQRAAPRPGRPLGRCASPRCVRGARLPVYGAGRRRRDDARVGSRARARRGLAAVGRLAART